MFNFREIRGCRFRTLSDLRQYRRLSSIIFPLFKAVKEQVKFHCEKCKIYCYKQVQGAVAYFIRFVKQFILI